MSGLSIRQGCLGQLKGLSVTWTKNVLPISFRLWSESFILKFQSQKENKVSELDIVLKGWEVVVVVANIHIYITPYNHIYINITPVTSLKNTFLSVFESLLVQSVSHVVSIWKDDRCSFDYSSWVFYLVTCLPVSFSICEDSPWDCLIPLAACMYRA